MHPGVATRTAERDQRPEVSEIPGVDIAGRETDRHRDAPQLGQQRRERPNIQPVGRCGHEVEMLRSDPQDSHCPVHRMVSVRARDERASGGRLRAHRAPGPPSTFATRSSMTDTGSGGFSGRGLSRRCRNSGGARLAATGRRSISASQAMACSAAERRAGSTDCHDGLFTCRLASQASMQRFRVTPQA